MGHQAAPGPAEIQQQQSDKVSTRSTLMTVWHLLTEKPGSVYDETMFHESSLFHPLD